MHSLTLGSRLGKQISSIVIATTWLLLLTDGAVLQNIYPTHMHNGLSIWFFLVQYIGEW